MNPENLPLLSLFWLADIILQSTAILCVCSLIVKLKPCSAASRRYVVWTLALASIPLLMAGTFVSPNWRLFRDQTMSAASKANVVGLPMVESKNPATHPIAHAESTHAVPAEFTIWKAMQTTSEFPENSGIVARTISGIWLFGFVGGILLLMLSGLALRKLRNRSLPELDERLLRLFEETKQELGLALPASVLCCSVDCQVPMTWGLLQKSILLPQEAVEWTDARLKLVLRHEMAHIARHDIPVSLLNTVSALLLWFHPLVWMAWRASNQAREAACDDLALKYGCESREDFASELLDAVKSLTGNAPRPLLPLALAMASSSACVLKNRLAAILDEKQPRMSWSKQKVAMLTATTLCVTFSLSGLTACRESKIRQDRQILITSKVMSVPIDSPLLEEFGLTLNGGSALTNLGIMPEEKVKRMLQKFSADKNVELISAPSVTTRSGMRATTEAIREFIYPSKFDPPQFLGAKDGKDLSMIPGQTISVTPTTPTTFEMRPVGVRLEFDPVISSEDGIKMEVKPEFTTFKGFINYGSPIKARTMGADGLVKESTLSENRMEQPVFHTLKSTSSVELKSGDYLLMGGLGYMNDFGIGGAKIDSHPELSELIINDKPDKLVFFVIQASIVAPGAQ